VANSFLDLWRAAGRAHEFGKTGSLPAPLDRLNGETLAGRDGTHPLAFLSSAELLTPCTGALSGSLEAASGSLVGGEIHARLRVRATQEIKARGTRVALKGHLVREVTQSHTEKVGDQEHTTTWIEVMATEIANVPLIEVAVPATLAPGDEIDLKFLAPAPKLGPPSLHLGLYMVVWTLQVEWDIAAGADERVAAVIDVAQNPDLLRSGVLSLGPSAMMGAWSEGEVSMDVDPAPPIAPGGVLRVNVRWPSASGGRGARVELYADLKMAPPVRIAAAELQTSDLAKGSLITFEIPSDAPPVFDGAGLSLRYRIRTLIDRPLRSDLAAERNVVIG
jgi:hypothetical protein